MQSFLGKKILLITAHPDDESYLAAGTIFRNYNEGGKTYIICATCGEKGSSHLKKAVSKRKFASMRRREFAHAARFLRITRPRILTLPDGGLHNRQSSFLQSSLPFAKRIKPDAIVSFGPDGITGHYDHITAGKVAAKVARSLQIPLFVFSLPPSVIKTAAAWVGDRRKSPHYIPLSKLKFRKPTLRIEINGSVKKRAIRYHKSQLDGRWAFTGFPIYVTKALLRAEYFVKDNSTAP